MTNNLKLTIKPQMGAFPIQIRPGQEVILDYTDMVDREEAKRYLLVLVDAFTGWPEAWPARREDSQMVVKCSINHYIPRHWFPEKIGQTMEAILRTHINKKWNKCWG